MRSHSTCLRGTAALAGVLTLALCAVPAVIGSTRGGALVPAGFTVQGDRVMVQVASLAGETLRGTVFVSTVLANGTTATATAPVEVPGGGAATVVLALPDDVRQVIVVGSVLDDGTPFGPQ